MHVVLRQISEVSKSNIDLINELVKTSPSFAGVCSLRPIYIRTGEMVVLRCPLKKDANATLLWTTPSRQGKMLTSSVSAGSADIGQMDMMPRGRSLVILTASMKHHGNYSCSIR